MVKLLPQQFKAFRKVRKGLVWKYEGPFTIGRKVGKVLYELELPSNMKIHNVFHVSYLKPYHEDMEDPTRGESNRAPMAVVTSFDRDVEEIIAKRTVRGRVVPTHKQYLVRWKGCPTEDTTWEKEGDLWQF